MTNSFVQSYYAFILNCRRDPRYILRVAGGTQMLADRQRMSVDRRQVNMDQEIWGTPQMFNQQTHWDFQVYNWLC